MPRADYSVWYNKARWRHMAKAQLRKEPLCCMCSNNGRIVPATVADHVNPHRGNQNQFWFGKLQSLCASHHNTTKKADELRGFSTEIGIDGYPTDSNHPVYRGSVKRIARIQRTTYHIPDSNVQRLIPSYEYEEEED